MRYCKNCDNPLLSISTYCEECGSKESYNLVCTCGESYSKYNTFCNKCGKELKDNEIIYKANHKDRPIFKKGNGNFFTIGNTINIFFNKLANNWFGLFNVSKLGFRDGYAFVLLSPFVILWWVLLSALTFVGSIIYALLILISMIWAVLFELPSDVINGRTNWD